MENPSKPNAAIILQRLLLLIFIIFPVTLAVVAQGISLVHSWNFIKTVQVSLLVAVFLTPVVAVFTNPSFWAAIEKSEKFLVVWIIATAIGVRVILIPLISTDFVSDMRDIHLFAVDISTGDPFVNLDKYRYIPHATYLTMSGYVLSFIYQIFGASTAVAKLFLAFLSVLTTWLIYLIGKETVHARVGLVASFLYATLPSLICYTGVLAGDHFAIPLIVLSILIHARLFRPEHSKAIDILIGYALCGAVIGFVDWFRPIGILLLIALSISLFIHQLRKRAFFQMALALSVMVISFFTISKLATVITESIFKVEVFTISQRIGAYLLTGLNPESSGGLTIDDGRIIGETYRDFGADYAGANRYLIEVAFARLEDGDLPKLFIEKFDLMWSNHIALFDYALIGSNDQEIVYLMAHFEALLFIVVSLFIVVGAINSFVEGSHPAVLTMQLFMLGFALLMLFLEVQNRYIVVVLPYSVLLGTMGFNDAFSLKQNLIAKG